MRHTLRCHLTSHLVAYMQHSHRWEGTQGKGGGVDNWNGGLLHWLGFWVVAGYLVGERTHHQQRVVARALLPAHLSHPHPHDSQHPRILCSRFTLLGVSGGRLHPGWWFASVGLGGQLQSPDSQCDSRSHPPQLQDDWCTQCWFNNTGYSVDHFRPPEKQIPTHRDTHAGTNSALL